MCGICNNLYDKEVGLGVGVGVGVHVYVHEKTDTNLGRAIKMWHHRLPPGRGSDWREMQWKLST